MTNEIIPAGMESLALPDGLADQTRAYADSAHSEATRRAYRSDWRDFSGWCKAHGLAALPTTAETVALYLAAQIEAGHKTATVQRRLASIGQAHLVAGYSSPGEHPGVRATMRGIRRKIGVGQEQVSPATTDVIRLMVGALPDTLLGARDRALLLLGFASALRRSELVALDRADLLFAREGVIVRIARSKTDQEGAGREVGVAYGLRPETCPVRALQQWIQAAGITSGPVFRNVDRHGRVLGRLTPQSVRLIVQRAAAAAGLDPEQYGGHSLRAGLATSAAEAGAEERHIMEQTGHRSQAVARRYIRRGSIWRDNVSGKVGL